MTAVFMWALWEACFYKFWRVIFVSINEFCFCRVWWPFCNGGAGRRRAGSHRLKIRGLASSPSSIPGFSPLLSHHLLTPRLQHPAEAVGEDYQCWEQAERSLLQYGKAAVEVHVFLCISGEHNCSLCGWSALLTVPGKGWVPTDAALPLNRIEKSFFPEHHQCSWSRWGVKMWCFFGLWQARRKVWVFPAVSGNKLLV